jgi:hypothetical protein
MDRDIFLQIETMLGYSPLGTAPLPGLLAALITLVAKHT